MWDARACQDPFQLLAVLCREVLFRIGADDWARARHRRQGTRVSGVVWRDGLETLVLGTPGNGEAATHAEADGANALGVHVRPLAKASKRGAQFLDAAVVV